MNRIEREKKTVAKMIRIYCRAQHRKARIEDCPECHDIYLYARKKLERCPFGEKKTSCRKCRIHCYEPRYRESIRSVMRYAGPRMLFHSPLSALRHLYHELLR